MFEIAVNLLQGPFDSYEVRYKSQNTYQLILCSLDSPPSSLDLSISLNNSKFWDEFQNLHSKLVQTQEAFSNFKQQKTLEDIVQDQELQKKNELYQKNIEKLDIKLQRIQNLNKSLQQEKNCVEEMLSHEREYIKTLEGKIKENLIVYGENLKKAEERDSIFVNRLAEIMKENSDLQQKIQKLNFSLEETKNSVKYSEKIGCAGCDISEKLVDSSDFYSIIRFSEENLEILYKSMSKINEELIGQANFNLNKGLKSENEQMASELKKITEKLKEQEKELKEVTELKDKLLLEIAEQDFKLSEKCKEIEHLYQKIKQDTMENTILYDSLEIQPQSLNSSKTSIENQEKYQIQDLEIKIKDLESQNSKLTMEIFQLKSKTIQELKLERMKVDSLDLQIEKFCLENGFENLFVKVFSGLYLFGSKQVNISYEKDQILCRFGGFNVSISTFLKNESQKGVLVTSNTNEKVLQSPRLKNKNSMRENEAPDEKKKEKIFSPVRKHFKRIY